MLTVTFDEVLDPKRQSHLYSLLLYISDSTSHTSIFTYLPITSDCCKGYRPGMSYIFLLCGTGIVLVLSYIYSIAPFASAFDLRSFEFYVAEMFLLYNACEMRTYMVCLGIIFTPYF